jgi:demethylmenaquinone methyltransferase/2-methoxy-6-polyprenyl-1,4-benzoquinol methylase
MFDRIVPTYDGLNMLMSASIDRAWRRKAVRLMDIGDGDLVLDVATGTGDMALLAEEKCRCKIVGIDLSEGMLRLAGTKWTGRKRGQYHLVQGDAAYLPFRDGIFDLVMVAFGIRNMVDVPAFLAQSRRVLRTNGRLVLVEMSLPDNRVLRSMFNYYLMNILPVIARVQRGDAAAYRYLGESIIGFSPPGEVEVMLERNGFQIKWTSAFSLGICHLYIAQKDEV